MYICPAHTEGTIEVGLEINDSRHVILKDLNRQLHIFNGRSHS